MSANGKPAQTEGAGYVAGDASTRLMPSKSDVRGDLLHWADELDTIASRQGIIHARLPFDRSTAADLIGMYAHAVGDVTHAYPGDGESVDLLRRWAGHVAALVSRWELGMPLAMSPFRSEVLALFPTDTDATTGNQS